MPRPTFRIRPRAQAESLAVRWKRASGLRGSIVSQKESTRVKRRSGTMMQPSKPERVHVLILTKGLGAGGAERLVSMSARLGDRQSFSYEVAYLLPWKRDLVEELEREGIAVHCLEGGREWNLRWAFRLRRMLQERHVDVLHLHLPYVAGIARVVAWSLPRKCRPRLVYTEHLPWPGYALPSRLLNAATYPLDDAHVAVSDAVRNSIPFPLRKRVRVVVHGIPLKTASMNVGSREDVRKELQIRDEEVLLGTVAHYRRQKGYPDLLKAARKVLDAGVPARFLAVGDGPLEGEIRALHRSLELGDRFLLLGRRQDVMRILSGCDLFVLASLYEGLPIAIMEALSLGLPIVGTAVPGIEYAVTHEREGLLAPPSRPDRLASAILTLVQDPARRARMRRAALERVAEFDITRALNAIENVYRERARGERCAGHPWKI